MIDSQKRSSATKSRRSPIKRAVATVVIAGSLMAGTVAPAAAADFSAQSGPGGALCTIWPILCPRK